MRACSCPARPASRPCWPTRSRRLLPGVRGATARAAAWRWTATAERLMALNLGSRLAQRVLIEVAAGAVPHEDDLYALARRVDWDDLDHAAAHAARGHHRAAQPAAEPELRRAAHQGRGVRPAARTQRRAPERRHARSPTCSCVLHLGRSARHAVCRRLGRVAVQARLARGQGRRAAEGNAGRRDAGRRRLARHAGRRRRAARPVLRLRHHRHRGGADRLRHRAGAEAALRLRAAAALCHARCAR